MRSFISRGRSRVGRWTQIVCCYRNIAHIRSLPCKFVDYACIIYYQALITFVYYTVFICATRNSTCPPIDFYSITGNKLGRAHSTLI